MDHLHALVMAGGSGTRFWPASRKTRPKQLLAITPGSEASLLESTIRRILPVCPAERIVVVTGEHLLEATRAALAPFPGVTVVAEPVPRNTAPCIAWGAALCRRRDPDAVVMALPSDHHIEDEVRFRDALLRAARSASSGPITTLGLTPSRPETGFGYIEASEPVSEGVLRAARFVEKPDLERAREYVAGGRHFWNSGMFFFRADVLLAAVKEHLPDLSTGVERIDEAARRGAAAEQETTRRVFPTLPNVSIDYGVMEKVSPIHVVPAEFGWSDVGSWLAAWELGRKDPAGNASDTDVILVDSAGNLVSDRSSRKKVIALVGVHDLCVVETDDALLVIPRERAQDVREVVAELERRGLRDKL